MKKILSFILILSLLAGALTCFAVTASAYALGDVNGDGRVNALDAALLSQSVLGRYGTALSGQMGDLDADGRIAAKDLSSLALYFVGRYELSGEKRNCGVVKIDGADLSEFSVVLPTEAPEGALVPNAEYASELLVTYIKEACGLTLPVTDVPAAHNIYITYDETLGDEAYEIRVSGGSVYLRCGILRGPAYAAFGFLEQIMGMTFYPRDVVKTAKAEKVEIPAGYTHSEGLNTPFSFRWAYNNCNIDWLYHAANSQWYKNSYLASHNTGIWYPNEWIMSERYGYGNCSDRNHSVGSLTGLTGGDINKFCFTKAENRNAIEAGVRRILDACLESGCKLGSTMPKISVSMEDSLMWCECRNCKKFLLNNGAYSGSLVDCLNDLSDRLTPDYPGVELWTLAYFSALKAPKGMELRDNIYICYAPIGHCTVHPLEDNCYPDAYQNVSLADTSFLQDWLALTDKVHVWWYGCNFYMTLFYQPHVYTIYKNITYLASLGVKGVFFQNDEQTFGFTDITSYLCSKLLWNPDITYEEYLEIARQFCIDYYGSEAAFDVLMLCEEMKSDDCMHTVSHSKTGIVEYDKSAVLENYGVFYGLCDEARAECTDPEAAARLNRALYGVESVVLSDCHEALYKNGTAEEKAEFVGRYRAFWSGVRSLGNACLFSIFQGVLDAGAPETFNPEITPYDWYFIK